MTNQEALTKQVKEASDIVDLVGAYVSLRPVGPTYKGLCPFHNDHRPSFDVDPRRQRYRCWACGKWGDVYTFIQEIEHVDFLEARELLAQRAGISLKNSEPTPQQRGRARMLDVVRWAAEQYHECLLNSAIAEDARRYVGERHLTGETVRRYGLGYAPLPGDWLVGRAAAAKVSFDVLEEVGLLGRRSEGAGFYDRFRDRVLFPIRDVRGHTIGFGGRILPASPLASRAPKYYNTADTPLFTKGEHLYGLDVARQAAGTAGYLAIVEGYTDVLMAHQLGVLPVVAPMGTALGARHVQSLRRIVPKVILVFDADAGGMTGVDRALELFVSQDVDLAIATLPDGLDPCDLLVAQGADAFRTVLASAVDALDFKLNALLAGGAAASLEGRRRAVDAVLGIIALAPEAPGQAGQVKRELLVTRIASRLSLQQETVWARLTELRRAVRQKMELVPVVRDQSETAGPPPNQAAPHEKQLLRLLLAEPSLVAEAAAVVPANEIENPGLRRLLEGLYALHEAGATPNLDALRPQIVEPGLAEHALEMQDIGRLDADRVIHFRELLAEFRRRRERPQTQELQNQLTAASDHSTAIELLRRIQNQSGL